MRFTGWFFMVDDFKTRIRKLWYVLEKYEYNNLTKKRERDMMNNLWNEIKTRNFIPSHVCPLIDTHYAQPRFSRSQKIKWKISSALLTNHEKLYE